MLNALLLRIGLALGVALGVATLVFLLLHLAPGDPVEAMLGESASAADRAALRTAMGLDAPLPTQWLGYVRGLLHGDLGLALGSQHPVSALILARLPQTALLAVSALVLALALALPLGLRAALRPGGGWDRVTSALAVLGMSLPSFVLGPLLMMAFAVWLGLAAPLARMVRVAVGETLREPFIVAAHARGLSGQRVLWRHALRNAALPVLTLVGMQLGALLGGAVVTEMVFGWAGIGQLVLEAIQRRDYPLVQGCVLTISLSYVAINLLTDVLYQVADPRVRAA